MKIDQHPFATNMVDEAGEFLFYRLEVILGKMKTHQQIKSLECKTSLIKLKELAEKNSEVTDRKINCKGIVKDLLYWMCINFFRSRTTDIYSLR